MSNSLRRFYIDQKLPPVDVEVVPVRDLFKFATAAAADIDRYGVLPIDPIRAAAQARNPVAGENDGGLMVAYSDGRCIGHQGLLPIEISIEGEISKMIATVALFLRSDFRSKRTAEGYTIAEAIYRATLDLGFDIMNTGFGRPRRVLHERRPEWFCELKPLSFNLIRLARLQPFSAAVRRFTNTRGLKVGRSLFQGIQKSIERPLAPFEASILKLPVSPEVKGYRVLETDSLEVPDAPFLKPEAAIYFRRSLETIRWMVSSIWHPIKENPYPRCFFCNAREKFEFRTYMILDRNERTAGFFIVSESMERLYSVIRILDCRITSPVLKPLILNFVIGDALRRGANMVECSNRFTVYLQRNRLLKRLTSLAERPYWLGLQPQSRLRGRENEVFLDYCDGERPYL